MRQPMVAWLLLLCVPAGPEPHYRQVWGVLQQIAVEQELVDGTDTIPHALDSAINWVSEKLLESHDFPSKESLERFPSSEYIKEAKQTNCVFRASCSKMWDFSPRYERYYFQMCQEAEEIWITLDLMEDVRNPYFSLYFRRRKAAMVRERIGNAAYNLGQWPHPLPIGHFVRD